MKCRIAWSIARKSKGAIFLDLVCSFDITWHIRYLDRLIKPPPRKTHFRLLASSAGWNWLPTGLLRKVSDTAIRYIIILYLQST